ncbi:asparagine synthase (glutamine-hydrolyzing) [Pedobacter sp. HMF7647]|uniref:asparagine synthase (glutamine-hydrolyzing) n=1 Tax=Hufsiella arboris TaxID=2695275 RepID=A0A7K1YE07_9SPHI|nr:asparagine synthase (glutamine-hydrolyzing) [Hufsiella arboris]MXV52836.1 asparagine synthase (glutamine-hydrolyzing) [Hufsiella arboris]
MCRIAGIVSKKYSKEQLYEFVKAMADIQAHGGPDDAGYYSDEELPVALSHRRLSLLDLSPAGHQPMFAPDERIAIVFNGEIYNFPELKSELVKIGHQFKSTSDTEVILHAYQEWGNSCFAMFKGMFAFGLLDKNQQCLYLVRDQQGIKPLYYYQKDQELVFASEVKAFKKAPIHLEPSEWKTAFLSCGHLPAPMTTLKDVFMLSKGHFLKYNFRSGETVLRSYKEESHTKLHTDLAETQQLVDDYLDRAIRRQLVSDASIGVFLSGGIDSSLLALQAAKYQGNNLLTVSLHFPEARFSEKSYQKLVSDKLPGQHISSEITKKDFHRYLQQILDGMDQPTTDGINSWFVSKAAHDAGLTAVLSGIGADELFGGYPSFKRVQKIPMARSWRKSIQFAAALTGKDALKRAGYLKNTTNSIYEYLFLRGLFNPQQIKNIAGINGCTQEKVLDGLPEPVSLKPGCWNGQLAAWYEQNYFMQNQLLKDADFMSMQHGLEIRVPFLDDNLVEIANNLDEKVVFDPAKPAKHLLINAFGNLLPEQVWNRPKMGFTFPFQEWLQENDAYRQLKNSYKNNAEVESMLRGFEAGKIHWSKPMSLLVMRKFEENAA